MLGKVAAKLNINWGRMGYHFKDTIPQKGTSTFENSTDGCSQLGFVN